MRRHGPWAFYALLAALVATPALAEDPQVHALVDVRIVTAPGQVKVLLK